MRPETIGAVLPGYAPVLSRSFTEWLDDRRSVLSAAVLWKLLPRLRDAVDRGEWSTTDSLAQCIQRVDDLNEEAALSLAEAHCHAGARTAAAEGLQRFLARVGEQPSEARVQVRAFLERIRSVAQSGRTFEPRFVGRREELRRIDELLHAARLENGGALILTGPAGIGKTRLLHEASVRAKLADMQVVRIRCQRGTALRPLSVVADLVPQLLELRGAAGCDPENLARLRRLAHPDPRNVGEHQAPSSPHVHRSRIVAALLDIIDAVSSESALLVEIDDVQWADPSLGWLWDNVLAWSSGHAVCWLFAQRSARHDRVAVVAPAVAIGSLDQASTNELLDDLVARTDRRLDRSSRDALMARGAGSPLFLRELTRQWGTTGRCDELPGSLLTIFDVGLSSLDRYTMRVLQVSAVLDTYATLDRIECVAALPRAKFIDAISDLEASGILSADARGTTYGHVLWAEAALARLSQNVARIMHRHAAERLDVELVTAPSLSLLWECARHWDRAGRPERASACVVQGAEHLVANGFVADAARAYERIITHTDDAVVRLALLARRVRLLTLVGDWSDVRRAVESHETLALELDPAYDSHNDLEILKHRAIFCQSADVAQHFVSTLRCAQDHTASNSHRLHAARECAKAADLVSPDTLHLLFELSRQLPQVTDSESWDAAVIETHCHYRVGDIQTGITTSYRMSSLANGDPARQCFALLTRALGLTLAGRIVDAKNTYVDALTTSKRSGLFELLAVTYDFLIGLSFDFDPAHVTRRIIDDAWSAVGNLGVAGESITADLVLPSHEAQFAVMSGDTARAIEWAIPRARCIEMPVPRWKVRLVGIHAAAALREDRFDDARELACHMAPCFDKPDFWLDWPASVYANCLVHDDPERATRFATRFVHSIRRELYPAAHGLDALAQRSDSASRRGLKGVVT
ncbi:MAG: hypothetical protein JWM41_3545 [Gemmatimonadetes bacterium]|nr:hypothetical protein [Gemmatimonadota bacterium]